MPALAPVTLDHSQDSTKTYVTLTPTKIEGGIAFWTNYAAPTPSLAATMTASVAGPSKTSRLQKVRMKIIDPVPKKSADGSVTTLVVDHLNTVDVNFTVSESATRFERLQLLNLLKSAVEAYEVELFLNGEMFY